jgi:hypothetical protein
MKGLKWKNSSSWFKNQQHLCYSYKLGLLVIVAIISYYSTARVINESGNY